MRKTVIILLVCTLAVPGLLFAAGARETEVRNQLEIFSWWTAGGEAEGLDALFDIYSSLYPDVEVINATVAGGAGAQAKAVLATRMQGGNPPDSFQVHAGRGLVDTWVVANMMEPITFIYEEEGWLDAFPQGVIDMVSDEGEIYSVPANIHRSNVLWYNKPIFDQYGLSAPVTIEEFFDVAEELAHAGVTPLALGDVNTWEATHLLESVLLASLGPDAYAGLWDGATPWDGPEAKQALDVFVDILEYVNTDHAALTWDEAAQYVIDGRAAMTVMGDWAHGYFMAMEQEPGADYHWIASPGTEGTFMMLSDTFGLPKGAPHRSNAVNWLKVVGSVDGQDAFNPRKGSIPARTDTDRDKYDIYLQSAMTDFAQDTIVASVAHGAAASEAWATDINDVISMFVSNKNVDSAASSFARAAKDHLSR